MSSETPTEREIETPQREEPPPRTRLDRLLSRLTPVRSGVKGLFSLLAGLVALVTLVGLVVAFFSGRIDKTRGAEYDRLAELREESLYRSSRKFWMKTGRTFKNLCPNLVWNDISISAPMN